MKFDCSVSPDMAATTTASAAATAMEIPRMHFSALGHRRLNPTKMKWRSLAVSGVSLPTAGFTRPVLVRASDPESEQESRTRNESDRAFTSLEDLDYLWKLGAGSIAGAAAIKYGSILFPEITRPNILEAMIIITTPVLVVILLLIRQSRIEQ
ncbi:uncharacterized protein LOC127789821 [Diospyros lotus]|uniref:uncharacterized protein LOC127789821 n=1 Tax=Diospyros lotus TaxID=55363 RepID=UPI0022510DDF|nr:uncharacterized protein LOC127789821 [Diospyros lotus]